MKGIVRYIFAALVVALLALPSAKPGHRPSGAPQRFSGPAGQDLVLADVRSYLQAADQAISGGDPVQGIRYLNGISTNQVRVFNSDAAKSELVAEAIKVWNQSEVSNLVMADRPSEADVVVVWVSDLKFEGAEIAGYTTWTRSDNGTTATIQVRTEQPNGKPFSLTHQRQIVMHELGHVLGLGDVDSQTDLMGPLNLRKTVPEPRPHEVKCLIDLQDQIEKLREQALVQLAEQTATFRRD